MYNDKEDLQFKSLCNLHESQTVLCNLKNVLGYTNCGKIKKIMIESEYETLPTE